MTSPPLTVTEVSGDRTVLRHIAVARALRPYALLGVLLFALLIAQGALGDPPAPSHSSVYWMLTFGGAAACFGLLVYAAPHRVLTHRQADALAAVLVGLLYLVQGCGMLLGPRAHDLATIPAPLVVASLLTLSWPVWLLNSGLGVLTVAVGTVPGADQAGWPTTAAAAVSVVLSGAIVTWRRRSLYLQALRNAEHAQVGTVAASTAEQLRSVMESASDGIAILDEQARVVDCNPAAKIHLGHAASEAVGVPFGRVVNPAYRREVHDVFRTVLAGQRPDLLGRPFLLSGWHKDGHPVPLEATLGQWQVGGQRYFTCVFRDVSERLAAQKALRDAEVRASRQRSALMLQDQVVQGLVVALYALDEGDLDTVRGALTGSLDTARAYINDILGGSNLATVLADGSGDTDGSAFTGPDQNP